jgi:hypothetical protein
MKRSKKFIKKLQSSDEHIKQRWLWGLTAVSGFVVVLVWSFYISLTVEKINDQRIRKHTLSQVLSAGLQSVKKDISYGLNSVLQSRTITLNQPERKFVYEEIEKTEIVKLP